MRINMDKLTVEDLTYLNKHGYIFPADNGEFRVMKYGDDEREIMNKVYKDRGIDIIQ